MKYWSGMEVYRSICYRGLLLHEKIISYHILFSHRGVWNTLIDVVTSLLTFFRGISQNSFLNLSYQRINLSLLFLQDMHIFAMKA